jgi:septum site-determining protein MinC
MFAQRRQTEPPGTPDPHAPRPSSADEPPAPSNIAIRGRSFLALVVAPEPPLETWFAALDRRLRQAPGFLAGRPVIADLAQAAGPGAEPEAALDALDGLIARGLKVIGAEGIDPQRLAGTHWAGLPTTLHGRDAPGDAGALAPPTEAPSAAVPRAPRCLLIDRPVRSGQSIIFEAGDVTVVGSVASGAEVIAGGSIHVYGALRGRAIAGLHVGDKARIFCRKLEAELVAVGGVYRTAEHWGAELHGRPAQIRREKRVLRLTALD